MSSSTPNFDGDEAHNWVVPSSISECGGIENLPDDLVMEIIARSSVSYKSVTRCKSVCKRWFNLIISPLFVHHFLCLPRLLENEPLGLIQLFDQYGASVCETRRVFTQWSPFSLSLSFLPCCDEKVWILASFNDLLVCCPNIYDHSAYYVCNPITKQFLVLPPHPRFSKKRIRPFVKISFALICDPYYNVCDGSAVINPGYTFKLVCFHASCNMDTNSVDNFSSETGKWSTLAMQGWDRDCYANRVVVFNGMVLWRNSYNSPGQLEGFDTRDCCDGEVRVCEFGPPLPSEYDRDACFGLCRGNLRLLSSCDGSFYVWELMDGSWSLVHEVPILQVTFEDERLSKWLTGVGQHRALSFHPSDGDIVCFRPFDDRTFILMCNLRTMTVEVVGKDVRARIVKVGGGAKGPYSMPYNIVGIFPLVLPAWPTPLPILPQMNS